MNAGGAVLFVKMSSLGDVIHHFPAVTDLALAAPHVAIDWVVEEAYAPLVALHPAVRRAIPVNVRRLSRHLRSGAAWRDFQRTIAAIQQERYRAVVDTQGLIKSAVIARLARGERWGMDRTSAREPLAALAYQHTLPIARAQHAVARNRELAGRALGHAFVGPPVYGLARPAARPAFAPAGAYAAMLHATSRSNKEWPVAQWVALGRALAAQHIATVLPWGSAAEEARSRLIAREIGPMAVVAPPMHLPEAAALLAHAVAVVGVDTGLAHLAVALAVPTVGIYVATDPGLTGLLGESAINLGAKGQPPPVDAVLAKLSPALEPHAHACHTGQNAV